MLKLSHTSVIINFVRVSQLSTKSAILEQEQYAIAGAVAEETLTNMKTVTAFGGQSKEINRLPNL